MNTPFPPPFHPFTTGTTTAPTGTTGGTGKHKDSVLLIVFIIFAVIAIAIVIILFLHRVYRVLFRTTRGFSSYQLSISRTRNGTGTVQVLSDQEKLSLINSLPIITLASSLSVLPKSRNCAICCDTFLSDAELRLLPACSHAFHKLCADTWLKSNPLCPICQSSITLPFPPLLELTSGSFRLELGSVSNRRSELDKQDGNKKDNKTKTEVRPVKPPSTSIRSYSMDLHDYLIEEEFEVVPNPPRVIKQEEREVEISNLAPPSPPVLPPPPPPSPPPPPKGWLQEYLDRIASSASSSFNSIRFSSQRWSGRWSQRWSQRFDSGEGGGAPQQDAWPWDLEAGQNEEAGGVSAIYRWLTGA